MADIRSLLNLLPAARPWDQPTGPRGVAMPAGAAPRVAAGPGGTAAGQGFSDPPDNPAVLGAIDQMRQGWQRDVDAYNAQGGNGLLQYGPFSPGGYANQAMQPGMSGYFDFDPARGGITPRIMDPQQSAQYAGLSPGQLSQGIYPSGGRDDVRYNIPNDRGGFFRLQDLTAARAGQTGGSPIGGAAQMGENLPSTNNWRLLGRGPGYIMRNGNIINTLDPATQAGLPLGWDTSFSTSGENMVSGLHRYVPGPAALAGRNAYGAYYWPGAESIMGWERWPYQTNV